jgi:hypothetical protein
MARSPARNSVFDHTSAHAGSIAATVTASKPFQAGKPVVGSMR